MPEIIEQLESEIAWLRDRVALQTKRIAQLEAAESELEQCYRQIGLLRHQFTELREVVADSLNRLDDVVVES